MNSNTRITELIPTNGRKSFNHKAKVIEDGEMTYLMSYNTIVCGVDRRGRIHRYGGYESATTRSHIKSFLNDEDYGKYFSLKVEPLKGVRIAA